MTTPKRTLIAAGVLGLVLAVAGCTKADQQKTQADTNTAADVQASTADATEDAKAGARKLGQAVKDSAKQTGNDLKAIAKDPEVKKAAGELKGSLKDLGTAVKDASRKNTNTTDEAAKK